MTGSSRPAIASAPFSPTYPEIGHTLRLLDGEPVKRVRDMMNAIYLQTGRPQKPIDWAVPDTWIDGPLSGELLALARKLWEGSGRMLNPRHLYASHRFVMRLKLLEQVEGIYRLNERGRRFLAGDEAILRELVTLRSSMRRGDRATPSDSQSEC